MDTCDKCGKTAELYHNEASGLAYCETCDMASEPADSATQTLDCIYLSRAQIKALYELTFDHEQCKRFGAPRVGVQLRGNADATTVIVLDAVLDEVDDLASATIEADGSVTRWTI